MHILFAGGGTAGHINPALAVASYIRDKHSTTKISYIGTKNKLESKLVPAAGFDFYTIDVSGFYRSFSPVAIVHNMLAVAKAVTSSSRAKKLLMELKPDLVIGTGGYVSGPVLRQAAKMGIKTAIHEQNAFPGVTTKMLAPMVDKIMLAMPEAEKFLKLKGSPIVTGNPVRVEFDNFTRETAREMLGLDERPMILSFGGSLGAEIINNSVADLIANGWKNNNCYYFHATGKDGYEDTVSTLKAKGVNLSADNVRVTEYINNMACCMMAADLIICRAGAITLSELQYAGKASILVPSPYVAENHQYYNAMTLKNKNAAELIEEKNLTGKTLIKTVEKLLSDKEKLSAMGHNASLSAIRDSNKRIYNCVMKLYNKS